MTDDVILGIVRFKAGELESRCKACDVKLCHKCWDWKKFQAIRSEMLNKLS